MKHLTVVAGAALLAVLAGSAARAHVIDPSIKADKPAAKLRADIGKQVSKYTFCLVKAASACEQKGTSSAPECNLATGAVSFDATPGKVTQKLHDAITKCDAKLDLIKKGDDYMGIGCPGDCNAAAPGVQECADMLAFEATIEATTGLTIPKVQLGLLAFGIDVNCATDLPGSMPTSQNRKDCVANNAKALSKYGQGLFKCQAKCENDFKNKAGNGGSYNSAECNSGAMGADPAFIACDSAALIKATKAGPLSPSVLANVLPVLRNAINTANNGLYNRFDPTGTPPDSPCGACGNDIREGAEECDGTASAACAGVCNADCTCP